MRAVRQTSTFRFYSVIGVRFSRQGAQYEPFPFLRFVCPFMAERGKTLVAMC